MKTLKSICATFLVLAGILSQACTANEYTPTYGSIGYNGAQLFSNASGKQTADNRLAYGDIVEFDANNTSKFTLVKNIATGVSGYVDTLEIIRANYPIESPFAFDEEQIEPALLNIESNNNGEIISGWALWKENGKIKALNTVNVSYNNGNSCTDEFYYIGEARPGYVILSHSILYGAEEGDKLDTPIVIYEDIAGRAGIFVGGKIFTPGGQLCGSDSDDWE